MGGTGRYVREHYSGKCQGKLLLEETLGWLLASDHCHQVSHGGSQVSGACKAAGKANTHTHTHTHIIRLIETFTAGHKPSWHKSIRKLGPIRMGAADKWGFDCTIACDHFVSWRLNPSPRSHQESLEGQLAHQRHHTPNVTTSNLGRNAHGI